MNSCYFEPDRQAEFIITDPGGGGGSDPVLWRLPVGGGGSGPVLSECLEAFEISRFVRHRIVALGLPERFRETFEHTVFYFMHILRFS